MISTPGDERNYYSELIGKRDVTGRLVFNTIQVTHMCDDCRLLPWEKAVNCRHWRWLLPPRKSETNEMQARALYSAGNIEDIVREQFGLICGDGSSIFDGKQVDACFHPSAVRPSLLAAPDVIYVTVDPGWTKSDTAYFAYADTPDGARVRFGFWVCLRGVGVARSLFPVKLMRITLLRVLQGVLFLGRPTTVLSVA